MSTGTITSQSGLKLREAFAAGIKVVLIGDTNHNDPRYREYLTRMMEDEMRTSQVSDVFIEQPDVMNDYVRRYMNAKTAQEESQIIAEMGTNTGLGLREDHQRMFQALKQQNEYARASGQPETRIHFMDKRLTDEENKAYKVVTEFQYNEAYREGGVFKLEKVPASEQGRYLVAHKVLFNQREHVNEYWAKKMQEVDAQNQREGRISRFVAFGGDGHMSRRHDVAKAADPRNNDTIIGVNNYAKDLNEMLRDRGIANEYWRLETVDNYNYYTGAAGGVPGDKKTVVFGNKNAAVQHVPDNNETPAYMVFVPDTATFDAERLRRSREAPPLMPEEKRHAEEARKLLLQMKQAATPVQVQLTNGKTVSTLALAGSDKLSQDARVALGGLATRAAPGFRSLSRAIRADGQGVLEYDADAIARLDDRQLIQLLPVIKETKRCCDASALGQVVTVNETAVLSDITKARALTRAGAGSGAIPSALPGGTGTPSPTPTTPGAGTPAGGPATPAGETPATPPPVEPTPGSGLKAYLPMLMAGAGGIAGILFGGGLNMQGLLIGLVGAFAAGAVGHAIFGESKPAPGRQLVPLPGSTPTQPKPDAPSQAPLILVNKSMGPNQTLQADVQSESGQLYRVSGKLVGNQWQVSEVTRTEGSKSVTYRINATRPVTIDPAKGPTMKDPAVLDAVSAAIGDSGDPAKSTRLPKPPGSPVWRGMDGVKDVDRALLASVVGPMEEVGGVSGNYAPGATPVAQPVPTTQGKPGQQTQTER